MKVPALNDSRHIGISVYNVFFPCALGMTVVNVVDNNPGVNYAVLSVLVVFCTTMTLSLVFIPKVKELIRLCLSNKWTVFKQVWQQCQKCFRLAFCCRNACSLRTSQMREIV